VNLETFQSLSKNEVARLVREAGPKVCVFPINGTRRWFMLERPDQTGADFVEAYVKFVGRRMIEIYQMFFEHGIDTILTPAFGPENMKRDDSYVPIGVQGLLMVAQNQEFLDFYDSYGVRVQVYGEAQRYFQNTPYARTLPAFEELARRTAEHRRHRLFFGVCAHDATEAVAEIAVHFYQEHGQLPDRRQIVETYYGEYVEPVDLFIGFSKFRAYFMPLLTTGSEDLYFSASPSLYFTERQLRDILYDHLYTRRREPDYSGLDAETRAWMGRFYQTNLGNTLGVGIENGKIWYPLPQIELPSFLADNPGQVA
jgi:hypothetical protein